MKNNNFDALRLLLASIVVLFHASRLSQEADLAFLQWFFSGTLAVQAFFAVSGFLIFMSFERSPSLGTYASKRARRILPAYLCVIVLSILLGACLSSLRGADYWLSDGLRQYAVFNLGFLNYKAPSLPGVFEGQYESAVNGSLWTLKIELMFYASVPILYWIGRRWPSMALFAVLYVASVLWHAGLLHLSDGTGDDLFAKLAKQFPGQLSFFVAGSGLYCWWRDGKTIHWAVALAAAVLYLLLGGMALDILGPALVAVMAIYFAVYAPWLGRVGRYGDFSYGVYIYHFPVVQTFIALGLFAKNPWGALAGVVATVACLSIASWHLVEKPMLRESRRRHGGAVAGPSVGPSGRPE